VSQFASEFGDPAAPVVEVLPARPRLEFSVFSSEEPASFRARVGFFDLRLNAARCKVARLKQPAAQLAPASPVFLVAGGYRDDRDLVFQDCSG
jgi:hypothetical protein